LFDRVGDVGVDMLVGEAIAHDHKTDVTGADGRSAYQLSSGIDAIFAVFSVPTTITLPPSGDRQLNDPCSLMTFHLVGEPSLCSRVDGWLHRECWIVRTDIGTEPALAGDWNKTRQDSAGRTRDMFVVEMPLEEKVLIQREQISRAVSLVALSEEAKQQFLYLVNVDPRIIGLAAQSHDP
jgi:hypothetical protein